MQARILQEFHLTLNSSMEQINVCLQAMIECLCPNHISVTKLQQNTACSAHTIQAHGVVS